MHPGSSTLRDKKLFHAKHLSPSETGRYDDETQRVSYKNPAVSDGRYHDETRDNECTSPHVSKGETRNLEVSPLLTRGLGH